MKPQNRPHTTSHTPALRNFLLGCLLLLTSLGLIASDSYQAAPENGGSVAVGGQLFQAWDLILEVSLQGMQHPLWLKEVDPNMTGPQTWRCVNCHGWDYQGRGEYPGLLAASTYSYEELVTWLDGSANPDHNFAQYLTLTALRDLVAFIQHGVVDYSAYRLSGTIDLDANEAHGEELYKAECRSCHGSDGARINFGTAGSPVFIGNIAISEPFHIAHVIRTGHLFLGIAISDDFGWQLSDVIDLADYTQAFPLGQQIQQQDEERALLDYSTHGDTTGMVIAAVGIVLLILLALGWYEWTEFRTRG